jgi:glycosyltransferase involved in cell wall biosynthesis
MSAKHIHIIAFDIPYPPDYGGVIDVFYKIKSLAEKGIQVHLHTFYRNREEADELMEYCCSADYYKQKNLNQSLSAKWPVMMYSRRSDILFENLLKDDYPILFEGIQSSWYLCRPELKNRLKIVRLHNVEWQYYHHLGISGKNRIKRLHWQMESRKLQNTESILKYADVIMPISPADQQYYEQAGFKNVVYLPVFHQNKSLQCKSGNGKYLLYHGNLSVPENMDAVKFLAEKVIPFIPYQVIIAGKNPPKSLLAKYSDLKNLRWDINPSDEKLKQLIRNAHINLLPTFQDTGIKLKLINALFKGRFCMVNSQMVDNTGLESICIVAEDDKAFISGINEMMQLEFSQEDIDKRKSALMKDFNNNMNICLLEILLKQ